MCACACAFWVVLVGQGSSKNCFRNTSPNHQEQTLRILQSHKKTTQQSLMNLINHEHYSIVQQPMYISIPATTSVASSLSIFSPLKYQDEHAETITNSHLFEPTLSCPSFLTPLNSCLAEDLSREHAHSRDDPRYHGALGKVEGSALVSWLLDVFWDKYLYWCFTSTSQGVSFGGF